VISRPYPSGGGLYELEVYPLVNRCEGLSPGLYRYDGSTHSLEYVAAMDPDGRQLVDDARAASRMRGEPHVLLLLAARFMRVNWKYESVAYSLILKNVGVLQQTMYLVATAMGLAACALGGGNSDVFCRLAGTDFWHETTVGEFLLGEKGADAAEDRPA
jgi:SagB-type dehydrogenase family enzyme